MCKWARAVWSIILGYGLLIRGPATGANLSAHPFRGEPNKPAQSFLARAESGRLTWGFQLGFGMEEAPPHDISHVKLLVAQPQIGYVVWNSPRSHLPFKEFEMVNEGIFGNAVHPGGRMTGDALLLRFDGRPHGNTVPFLDLGGGVMDTDLPRHAVELSGSTQFMPQGGIGVEHFFAPGRAWVLEYRFIHISNAGLQEPNAGFNGSEITVGLRWLRQPGPLPVRLATRRHRDPFDSLFGWRRAKAPDSGQLSHGGK